MNKIKYFKKFLLLSLTSNVMLGVSGNDKQLITMLLIGMGVGVIISIKVAMCINASDNTVRFIDHVFYISEIKDESLQHNLLEFLNNVDKCKLPQTPLILSGPNSVFKFLIAQSVAKKLNASFVNVAQFVMYNSISFVNTKKPRDSFLLFIEFDQSNIHLFLVLDDICKEKNILAVISCDLDNLDSCCKEDLYKFLNKSFTIIKIPSLGTLFEPKEIHAIE